MKGIHLKDVNAKDAAKAIQQLAEELVAMADQAGVTLEISLEPQQPLAMGNYRHRVKASERFKRTPQ